ncbi:hypothetical protein J3Q64DRAFT_1866688 [Phycomyces blakesleeanus]|uniref:Uncharacterized protein n=1 Tax=Phycomyces blakesleeanus TaxID=4837 RepID=A0ABR3ASM4_PHYBL
MLLQKLQFIQCVSVVAFIPKCYASPIEQDINPGYTAPEENRSQNLTEIKPSNILLLKEAYTSEYKKYENVGNKKTSFDNHHLKVICKNWLLVSLIIRARHFSSRARRFSGALRLLNFRLSPFTGLIKSDLLSGIQQFYLVPNHPK